MDIGAIGHNPELQLEAAGITAWGQSLGRQFETVRLSGATRTAKEEAAKPYRRQLEGDHSFLGRCRRTFTGERSIQEQIEAKNKELAKVAKSGDEEAIKSKQEELAALQKQAETLQQQMKIAMDNDPKVLRIKSELIDPLNQANEVTGSAYLQGVAPQLYGSLRQVTAITDELSKDAGLTASKFITEAGQFGHAYMGAARGTSTAA